MKYRKSIFILGLMVIVSTACLWAFKPAPNSFRNLQVYPKDVTETRVMNDMELFSRSLNVGCNYCHTKLSDGEWDYASDESPHKGEAREMMIMTNVLNEKYFKFNLKEDPRYAPMNCYTCHRGEEYPAIPWDTTNIRPLQ